jgi:toxin FitB
VKFVLDTCVVSEFTKPQPNEKLDTWLDATAESALHLSVVTIGEIQQGITRLPPSIRRQRLQGWLEDDLSVRFAGRILVIDAPVCIAWGRLRADSAAQGRVLPVIDSLIAATALHHRMMLVTRNERDFEQIPGLEIFNPWLD